MALLSIRLIHLPRFVDPTSAQGCRSDICPGLWIRPNNIYNYFLNLNIV